MYQVWEVSAVFEASELVDHYHDEGKDERNPNDDEELFHRTFNLVMHGGAPNVPGCLSYFSEYNILSYLSTT